MLSISFYSGNGRAIDIVRVSDDFYEWLARSEFSKLGRSQQIQIEIEGETAELPLVPLGAETRSKLIEFFSEHIFSETRSMLGDLDRSTPQPELSTKTYRLKKLLEVLDCLKSETYQYLQRE
jgi:hypothetical protein